MDDYAPFAYRGRVVRFSRIGRPRQYRVFLVGCGSAIRMAEDQGLPEAQLVARIQAVARSWGLSARLTSSDQRELVFEVGMAG